MLNIQFNIGKVTTELKTVVVKNIPPNMYKWSIKPDAEGNAIMQAEVDMQLLMEAWLKADRPHIFDATDGRYNEYPSIGVEDIF